MKTPDLFASPILITLPGFVRGEAETICALQRAGAGIIHIRKPGAAPERFHSLLDELREAGADFGRLTLHGDEALARRYGFGGLHIKADELLKRFESDLDAESVSGGTCPGETAGDRVTPPICAQGVSACGLIGDSPAAAPLRLSCSAHSWDEAVRWAPAADYVWLSPLFDSISKAGYHSGIDITQACERLSAGRRAGFCGQGAHDRSVSAGGAAPEQAFPFPESIVALGGIAPENIARVRMAGFGGAAVLGAVWAVNPDGDSATNEDVRPADAAGTLSGTNGSNCDLQSMDRAQTVRNFGRLDRRWKAAGGTLQLISDGDMATAEAFLEGGGRWIQLRMKEATAPQIVARGREMAALCRRHGALLLLNDHPELVAEAGAQGVHLGKSDMPPAEARALLGEGAIIGCTANTLEDILALSEQPADYVGLGPFRYTTTKKNLSPLLGEAGYRRILCALREQGVCLPVVAIGGICPEDVPTVMRTGVNGLAISGAIAHSDDPRRTTRQFVQAIACGRLGWEESPGPASGSS